MPRLIEVLRSMHYSLKAVWCAPRALALREQVSLLVANAEAVLRPAEKPDLTQLARTFTLRAPVLCGQTEQRE